MFDGAWTFRNLEGEQRHGPRHLRRAPDARRLQGNELVLNFAGQRRAAGGGPPRRAAARTSSRSGTTCGRAASVDLTAEVRYLSEREEVQRRRAGRAATREHVDRAGPLPLSPRPAPRRPGLSRRPRHLRALQGRARAGQGRRPRATAISSPTGGGTSTSPKLVGRSAPRRPRVDPGPARTAAKSRGRAESHRRRSTSAAASTWSGPAGRASRCARAGTCGSACSSRASSAAAFSSRTSTARCRCWAASTGSNCSRAANWPSIRSTTRTASSPR